MEEALSLSIEELEARTGVPARTVRFYISLGLLPGPEGRGKGTSYGIEHLLRLQLIRHLTEQRLPLTEVRDRLLGLSLQEVRGLLGEAERERALLDVREQSPREYISALLAQTRLSQSKQAVVKQTAASRPALGQEDWQRWELGPGLELHVRTDMLSRYRDLIHRILRMARGE